VIGPEQVLQHNRYGGCPNGGGESPRERVFHAFDSTGFNYLRIYISLYQAGG
jgi:hypothetical protein